MESIRGVVEANQVRCLAPPLACKGSRISAQRLASAAQQVQRGEGRRHASMLCGVTGAEDWDDKRLVSMVAGTSRGPNEAAKLICTVE
jgi:hypothetical protein